MRAQSRVAKKNYKSNGFTEGRGRPPFYGKAARHGSRDHNIIRGMIAR